MWRGLGGQATPTYEDVFQRRVKRTRRQGGKRKREDGRWETGEGRGENEESTRGEDASQEGTMILGKWGEADGCKDEHILVEFHRQGGIVSVDDRKLESIETVFTLMVSRRHLCTKLSFNNENLLYLFHL